MVSEAAKEEVGEVDEVETEVRKAYMFCLADAIYHWMSMSRYGHAAS